MLHWTSLIAALALTADPSAMIQSMSRADVRDEALPADFRGQVTYKGFYNGTMVKPARGMQRRATLNNILSGALNGTESAINGSYDVTIDFDGDMIRGNVRSTGTIVSQAFNGKRTGTACQIFWNSGVQSRAYCSRAMFRQQAGSTDKRGVKVAFEVDARAGPVVDYVERDRLAAVANAKAAEAAKVARQNELALRARMRTRLPKGADARYTPIVERAVLADSRSWGINRYRPGTIDLVDVTLDKASGAMFTKSYFQYSDGREGWVGVAIKGNETLCLSFSDEGGQCRAIGQGRGGAIMRGVISGLMSPPSGDSSSGPNSLGEAQRLNDYHNKMRTGCEQPPC